MKHYLVEIETQDGEREYLEHIVVDAESSEALQKKIGKVIEKVFSTSDEDKWDEEEGKLDLWEQIVTYKGWEEITDHELETLKKTIHIWHET